MTACDATLVIVQADRGVYMASLVLSSLMFKWIRRLYSMVHSNNTACMLSVAAAVLMETHRGTEGVCSV